MGLKPQKLHIGKVFGKLTIIDQVPGKKSICKCQCGNIKTVSTGNLMTGSTKSCGCLASTKSDDYDQRLKIILLRRIKKDKNGCWIWQGCKDKQGYGKIKVLNYYLAHRLMWYLTYGNIPARYCVCHKCDVTSCINPEHLFLGTVYDNTHDCIEKGKMNRCIGSNKPNTNLTDDLVKKIIKMKKDGYRCIDIEKSTGATKNQIQAIVHNRTWKHIER